MSEAVDIDPIISKLLEGGLRILFAFYIFFFNLNIENYISEHSFCVCREEYAIFFVILDLK